MTESVEAFAARARTWLAENMPRVDPAGPPPGARGDDAAWQRVRELQKRLHAGGFAGICFPREYGGLGLDVAYQKAFDAETVGYEMPLILNVPTFTICCASLLDSGSEEQKRQHISAALRGEEILVQLLSEPSGGSDLAGLITRADRDGDTWVINGAKTWSTSAFAADYGLLLARTDPTVPKHDGLTMFLVPIHAPGVTLCRIQQVDGSNEFCEEFFDGLRLGDDAVVGEVNKGWEVASRLLYHERRAVGQRIRIRQWPWPGSLPNRADRLLRPRRRRRPGRRPGDSGEGGTGAGAPDGARPVGRSRVPRHAQRVAPPAAGSIIRLFHSDVTFLEVDTAMDITGASGVVDDDRDLFKVGERYLSRQTVALGGGSNEMARNVIGERVLGFPREYAADRGVPFNQVRHNERARRG